MLSTQSYLRLPWLSAEKRSLQAYIRSQHKRGHLALAQRERRKQKLDKIIQDLNDLYKTSESWGSPNLVKIIERLVKFKDEEL